MPFSLVCVAGILALGCAAKDTEGPRRPHAQASVVGTWRALRYVGVDGPNSTSPLPFGGAPRGYIVYDPTGHVFFQISRRDAPSQQPTSRWREADSSALHELLRDATAYFGTYTVDSANGRMVHHIEGEIPPNRGSIEIATPYQIRGDTLVLGSDSSVHWVFVRVR